MIETNIMKKLLILSFVLLSVSISAQNIKFAIIAGVNASKLDTKELGWPVITSLEFKRNFGFQFGVSSTLVYNESINFISGLQFKRKQSSAESYSLKLDIATNTVIAVPKFTTFNFTYIQLPIFLEYSLNRSFGVYFGPLVEYRIGGGVKIVIEETEYSNTFVENPNNLDYGVAMGMNFRIGKGQISIEYNYNFNNVIEDGVPMGVSSNRFNSISLNISQRLN